jgi:hypothetical protein
MDERARAEEHLRVIRGLMERSTIYRAISAPSALVAGFAALAATALFHFQPKWEADGSFFVFIWIIVLTATTFVNASLICREAIRRSEPFLSSGMRLALIAVLPAAITGIVFTAILLHYDFALVLPIPWMICYGFALLAMSSFAPRSIVVLGWAFLLAGLGTLLWLAFRGPLWGAMLMGVSFGFFHIVYAAFIYAWQDP